MFRADKPLPAPPLASKPTASSLVSSRIQSFGSKPADQQHNSGFTAQEGKQAFSLAKKVFENPKARAAATKAVKYTAEHPEARAAAYGAAKTLAENPEARRTAFSVAQTASDTQSSGWNAPPKLPPKQPSFDDRHTASQPKIANSAPAVSQLTSRFQSSWSSENNYSNSKPPPVSNSSVKALSSQLAGQLQFGQPTRPSPRRPSSEYWDDNSYSEIKRRDSPPRPPSPSKRSSSTNRSSFPPPRPVSPLKSVSPPRRPPPPRSASSAGLSEPYGVAVFTFEGQNFDELSVDVNDIVLLKREVDAEWFYGCNSNTGRNGIVPRSFIDVKMALSPTHGSLSARSSNNISSGPRCRALFDYNSGTAGDLVFSAGQIIRLENRLGKDWLDGRTADGKQGIFPTNFVEIVEDLPRSPQTRSSKSPEKVIKTVTALFDYTSANKDDLNFTVGDKIEVLQEVSGDWYRGRLSLNPHKRGLFPANFVQAETRSSRSPSVKTQKSSGGLVGKTVVALYDYRGDDQQDLWFSAGDKITVTAELDQDWLKGKLQLDMNARSLPEGMFPRNFVQI